MRDCFKAEYFLGENELEKAKNYCEENDEIWVKILIKEGKIKEALNKSLNGNFLDLTLKILID